MTDSEFKEYKLLILSKLEDICSDLKNINNKIDDHGHQISALKSTSGFWGIIGGSLISSIYIILKIFGI